MYEGHSILDYGEEVREAREGETSTNDVNTIGESILGKIFLPYSHRISIRWIKELNVQNKTWTFMNKLLNNSFI